jgi:hypothetical protein
MEPIPRCRTEIERFELFSRVTITAPDGRTMVTTMDKFILPSDPRISKLKAQLFHRAVEVQS